jgi:hypothetical protein
MIPVCRTLTSFGTKDKQCKGKLVGVRNYASRHEGEKEEKI